MTLWFALCVCVCVCVCACEYVFVSVCQEKKTGCEGLTCIFTYSSALRPRLEQMVSVFPGRFARKPQKAPALTGSQTVKTATGKARRVRETMEVCEGGRAAREGSEMEQAKSETSNDLTNLNPVQTTASVVVQNCICSSIKLQHHFFLSISVFLFGFREVQENVCMHVGHSGHVVTGCE